VRARRVTSRIWFPHRHCIVQFPCHSRHGLRPNRSRTSFACFASSRRTTRSATRVIGSVESSFAMIASASRSGGRTGRGGAMRTRRVAAPRNHPGAQQAVREHSELQPSHRRVHGASARVSPLLRRDRIVRENCCVAENRYYFAAFAAAFSSPASSISIRPSRIFARLISRAGIRPRSSRARCAMIFIFESAI